MSLEANKALRHRFAEFINTASETLAAKLIAPDAQFYVPGQAEPMRNCWLMDLLRCNERALKKGETDRDTST